MESAVNESQDARRKTFDRPARYTKENVKALLDSSDSAVYRGLQAIYKLQTADEQRTHSTSHKNGVGFSGWDAPVLSAIAQRSQSYGTLTPGQTRLVRQKLQRYTGQLARIANGEISIA